jgi:uncharacterized protein (DUF58 family)
MKSTLRLNAKILPVIGLLALVMQFLDPSRVWIILLTGIGGIWLVCWWWARGLAKSLHFKREMRYGWAQVGDRLEERFTLTNDFALPATWVSVQDHSTLPNHRVSVATGVDRMSTSQWKKLNQCTQRGVFTLGGTTLETGDPFGIYTITIEDTTSSTLAVMPPIVSLPRFNILSSGWAGDGKISPRSLEETTNASHTREMVPGDPMKSIHWKTSARRNKFYVRQSDGTHAGDWWVLLDLHKDSQVGTGWDSTEEHGVILTSSLVSQGLREDHPVGLSINGSEPAWHIPRRNENQERSLLKSLAVASPSEMSLKDFLQRGNKAFSGRCSLLIITACVNIEWIESLMPLTWRGILPNVFLFDVNTFGGDAKINEVSSILQSLGIPCHIIPKDMLDKPQARPGHEGEWEWRVSATGKAIAVNKPVTEWKGLE